MTLTQAREAIAAVLSAVDGLDVRARPIAQPLVGDGWVVVTRVEPATFSACAATFTAVMSLGADEAKAEGLLETLAVPIIDAVTGSDLCPADVSLEAQTLVVGFGAAPLYVLALTMTVEVGS